MASIMGVCGRCAKLISGAEVNADGQVRVFQDRFRPHAEESPACEDWAVIFTVRDVITAYETALGVLRQQSSAARS